MHLVLATWAVVVGLSIPAAATAEPLVLPEQPTPWRLSELPDEDARILEPDMIAGVSVAPGSQLGVGLMRTRQKDVLRLPGEKGSGLKRRPGVGLKLNF